MSTFYVPLFVILILYAKIFMTARNRLRKRAAQKAKVTISGVSSRNYHKTCKESQMQTNSTSGNNTPGNKNASGVERLPNSINSTQTQLTSNNANTSENCCIILASTAATIDPKNNQIQTVVLSTTVASELHSNPQVLMKNKQGILISKTYLNLIFCFISL